MTAPPLVGCVVWSRHQTFIICIQEPILGLILNPPTLFTTIYLKPCLHANIFIPNSLTYMLNNSGDKGHPCITPESTLHHPGMILSIQLQTLSYSHCISSLSHPPEFLTLHILASPKTISFYLLYHMLFHINERHKQALLSYFSHLYHPLKHTQFILCASPLLKPPCISPSIPLSSTHLFILSLTTTINN